MPRRGHPDAAEILALRNSTNSDTYDALSPDELAVFHSSLFYSLGGYPDYSSATIIDDAATGESSILVPEVPKLSPEDKAKYRPIYNDLVNQDKVARDRELNTPATSSQKVEKRSLQCIKKIGQQVCTFLSIISAIN